MTADADAPGEPSDAPRRVFLKFDVEPDPRALTGRETDWPGFAALLDYLRDMRPRLEDGTGGPVNYTWHIRIDPHVASAFGRPDWALQNYGDRIQALREAGDDVGVHIHGWRPVKRWFRQVWMPDYADDGWAIECIEGAVDAYRGFFGDRPVTVSMGDGYVSNAIMGAFERLGLRCDISLMPGYVDADDTNKREKSIGLPPETAATRAAPYRPSKADFRVPGEPSRNLWELPLTAAVVPHEITGALSRRKLLLGMNPGQAKTICDANRAEPIVGADCRADVLSHPETAQRMRQVVENHRMYFGGRVRFVTCRALADYLDQTTGGPSENAA